MTSATCGKTKASPDAEQSTGGYYINAAQAGEPPGRWWGPGAAALGLGPGQVVERKPYNAVYEQIDPRTGEKLGRPRGSYAKYADHLARLTAAEPHATAERLIELERQAAQATRQPAAYTDVTVSFSKSISVLHASIRENARRARLAGDERAAAYWTGREEKFQAVLHRANRAALEYAQRWAGVTRTGYHGTRVDGQEPGRFEEAGLIVTSWLQGTSRDGDPQDHIHNQIARITRTVSDGKWRAHDTASLRAVIGALQAVAATAVECELTREFGVAWVPRADGRGNEIRGVTQAQMDAYSTRTVAGEGEGTRTRASVGAPGTAARRTRASCCTSPRTQRSSHARARKRVRSTGTRSPSGGTPRSAASWRASPPQCRTRAVRTGSHSRRDRRPSSPAGQDRPARCLARRRYGWCARRWRWCRRRSPPGPGTS